MQLKMISYLFNRSSLFFIPLMTLADIALAHPEYTLGGPTGWPGISHHWLPALKQGLGTAFEEDTAYSPVWFTVADGTISEIYYPSTDQAQIGFLEFIVTDGATYFSEQRNSRTISRVWFGDEGMTVHIEGDDKLQAYHFHQVIFTDSASPVLRVRTEFIWNSGVKNPSEMKLYVLLKPTIQNTAAQNIGFTSHDSLYSTSAVGSHPVAAALVASQPWVTTTTGYIGFSDPWQNLMENLQITHPWQSAGAGNISLAGELKVSDEPQFTFEVALGFGSTPTEAQAYAQLALKTPFTQAQEEYEKGWHKYLSKLREMSPFAKRSAQIIKMHEDKQNRGAIVASLSKPTLPSIDHTAPNSASPPQHQPLPSAYEYHWIWPRDLYYAAMALLAAGDIQTPIQTLRYFRRTQNKNGSWPHRFRVSGRRDGNRGDEDLRNKRNLRTNLTGLDGTYNSTDSAYAILLAHHLTSRGVYHLGAEDLEMIRKAVALILLEDPDFSSRESTSAQVATRLAALKLASQLLPDWEERTGIEKVTRRWQSSIEKWALHESRYDSFSQPGTEAFGEDFLKLIRLGIRSATDPRIQNSLPEAEEGRTLTFFPAREAAMGTYRVAAQQLNAAEARLAAIEESAIPSGLLPERLFLTPPSRLQLRLGVACPLVWGHAENILLHRSLEEGTVFDAPNIKTPR